MKIENVKVRNNLKEILKSKGIKQSWLSEKIGISPQYMSNICNNRDQPTLVIILKIAYILNVEVADIFYLVDEEKNN